MESKSLVSGSVFRSLSRSCSCFAVSECSSSLCPGQVVLGGAAG
uniref:Uncharacterized protein n=1 Tax=Anguilla anguilla TaxID=7936 RepID=A0A0E9TH84_ANGAN